MSSKMTRFESLLEAVPDALVGMDQKGVIRFVNRQTESLFGYDRDDLIGERIEKLVPDRLWQIYMEHRENYFADLRTRSSGVDLVLSGRQRDGIEFPVNVGLSHIDTGDVLLVLTAVRDVDKQRQAVEVAQLTAAVVEYSDDAIIASTLDGKITSWNPAAERMYGYSSQEILGRSATFLLPLERAGEFFANLGSVRQGRPVERQETWRVRRDGTVFPVSLTVAPIRDEDGAIVGASAVHRDVTVQRRAFELAQRIAAIVEGSDDAIFSRTLDGIVTSWNPAAERMYGYSSAEMIGKSVALLIPEDRTEEMKTILAGLRAGHPVERLETIRVRRDGTAFPISLTVSPVRDTDGMVVGASVISRDMTEHEHAAQYARSLLEAALDPLVTISLEGTITDVNEATVKLTGISRDKLIGTDFSGYFTVTRQKEAFEAAQRIAAIVEYSDDAIMSGSLDGLVTSWNPAAERMYGYSRDEILGRSGSILSPPDRRGELIPVLARIKGGEVVANIQTVRARKDGTLFPASVTYAPIRDAGGEIVGASSIARDVSVQK